MNNSFSQFKPLTTQNEAILFPHNHIIFICIFLNACTQIFIEESNIIPSKARTTAGITINFAGLAWEVKDAYSSQVGPGPNYFSKDNVWVDINRKLHLKIKKISTNKWTCAELKTQQLFGNGIYQFWVEGRPDLFDKNTVLGLFNYPCANGVCEPDGTHEIDIEFAKWGNVNETITWNYTTYPIVLGGVTYHQDFPLSLTGTYTTHRYTRSASSVFFQSLYGHQNGNTSQFASATSTNTVSTLTMLVYMNLWLFQGRTPSDKKEVEIVIRDFKFVAQQKIINNLSSRAIV